VIGPPQVGERSPFKARGVGLDDQGGDPLVLRNVRIGPDEDQEDIGVVGAGGPDLLAVDDELVSVYGTALVARAARSLPASGSLIPRAAVFSARMMGTAQSLIWSSLPNETMVALTMPRP